MKHEVTNYIRYAADHAVGTAVRGSVRAIANFGVFVELAPNIQGLLEVCDFAKEGEKLPEDYPPVGTSVDATIIWLDAERMNIRLTQRPFDAARHISSP